jgi:hypothetical protein
MSYGTANDLANEDWLKSRRWNVTNDWDGALVETIDELRQLFPTVNDDQFRSWPSMKAAPVAIRRALGLQQALQRQV